MEIELTLDADYMICVLYDEYLRRIKNGIPPDDAIFFGNCEQIQELVPQFTTVEHRDSAPTPPHKIPTPSPPKQPSSSGNKK